MFTGIVECVGTTLNHLDPANGQYRLQLACGQGFSTNAGDSVAVNGCCLTVVTFESGVASFDLSAETLAKTTLSQLKEGQRVNLERALRVGDRLGGHFVSGHVDGIGSIDKIARGEESWTLTLQIPSALSRFVIEKGSLCIDGVSLTVCNLRDESESSLCDFALIPATLSATTLADMSEGRAVNLEVDMLAKYVERLCADAPR